MQRRGTARIPPHVTAASQNSLPSVACLRLRLYYSGFESEKAFQPKHAPHKNQIIKALMLSMPGRGLKPWQEAVSASFTRIV